MPSRIPRKPETFVFEGVPNQRVSDVFFSLGGQFSMNWLRKALREGCVTRGQLEEYRSRTMTDRLNLMWERRDVYWARRRAEKTAEG